MSGYGTDAFDSAPSSTGGGSISVSSSMAIFNAALTQLGQTPIASLNEDTDARRLCRIHWPIARDAVLRNGTWKCLVNRVQLAREAEAPAFGYLYAYALPINCFRILTFTGSNPVLNAFDLTDPQFLTLLSKEKRWTREGKRILTDEESAYITFIEYDSATDDVSRFDSLLTAAISALLASMMAPALKSAARQGPMYELYRQLLREAKDANAWEASPVVANPTSLLDCR